MELPDSLEPVGAAPPRPTKAIVARSHMHAHRIIEEMGGSHTTGIAGDFHILTPGAQVEGRRYEHIFILLGAVEDASEKQVRWLRDLQTRLTRHGSIVYL